MVSVFAAWNRKDILPAGCAADEDAGIFRLERPKLSYARPKPPTIWIRRDGFDYEHFTEQRLTPDQAREARVDQVDWFLTSLLKAPTPEYHTRTTLDGQADKLGMTRTELREALGTLTARQRGIEIELPKPLRHGGRKTFLCPAALREQFTSE